MWCVRRRPRDGAAAHPRWVLCPISVNNLIEAMQSLSVDLVRAGRSPSCCRRNLKSKRSRRATFRQNTGPTLEICAGQLSQLRAILAQGRHENHVVASVTYGSDAVGPLHRAANCRTGTSVCDAIFGDDLGCVTIVVALEDDVSSTGAMRRSFDPRVSRRAECEMRRIWLLLTLTMLADLRNRSSSSIISSNTSRPSGHS